MKLKFTDHMGMYMLHCHMVEHEDDGMMTQFEVVAAQIQHRDHVRLRGRDRWRTKVDARVDNFAESILLDWLSYQSSARTAI